ncbi:MAG: Nif3-like dinuclear metal center hexameric protein [Phycisphaeraceae bacterium]|nr:MAG: Nif3-like dinuclear metal center hexameric protein [Phycisphaeraceae bacterium]
MNVGDVVQMLETIAPPRFAEPWDNVGLLVGGRDWRVEHVMLTIDLTSAVLDEAVKDGATMIVAYHPPIFEPLKSISDRSPRERLVLEAARRGIAVYSPHTALDAAPGGVNDWLAQGLGAGDVRSLTPHAHVPASEEMKIITFCPAEAADRLRTALSTVGAGRIGEYEMCSFETPGTGTFFGREAARPTVGKPGQLERVSEVKLEMVCPRRALALAVMTIRRFHPYEEPPIEIHELKPRPDRTTGQGRRVVLDRPVSLRTLVDRIRDTVGSKRILAAVGDGAPRQYDRIGLCAGAGGSLLHLAIDEGCQVFFTGEMRHHDVLAAQARGCTVILAGHTNTERGYLKILRKRMLESLGEAEIVLSKRDADPLTLM